MSVPLRRNIGLYEALAGLPEGLTGEILDGQIHTQPRPTGRHAHAESVLGMRLGPPYRFGEGGPGGWWILIEPEVHFVRDTEVAVPDLAGWRRERLPSIPEDQRFLVAPDWVCEILSPGSRSKDREIKCRSMPVMRSAMPGWSIPENAPWRPMPFATRTGLPSAAIAMTNPPVSRPSTPSP
jgi:hypothetical protein